MGGDGYSFAVLLQFLEDSIEHFPDVRTGKNNAQSIFGVHKIPTDNHIRSLLDPVSPQLLFPVFDRIFKFLVSEGVISDMVTADGFLLIALDGTWFYSLEQIACDSFQTKQHRNGVPLKDGDEAMQGNWMELAILDKEGTIKKRFSFVTDLPINDENFPRMIYYGRSRWKIENEDNNILKLRCSTVAICCCARPCRVERPSFMMPRRLPNISSMKVGMICLRPWLPAWSLKTPAGKGSVDHLFFFRSAFHSFFSHFING